MGIAHRGARSHPRCAAPAADRSVYFLRAVQDDHRELVGPIVVPAGGATPGTIGGAFDVWVQTQATHRPRLPAPAQGAEMVGPELACAFRLLMDSLRPRPKVVQGRPLAVLWDGPTDQLGLSDLLRLCWAACPDRDVRTGGVRPGRPIATLLESDAIDLLSLASEGALDEGPRALMRRILYNAVEERLDAEVCRFNALHAAVWPAAMSGDLRAGCPGPPRNPRRPGPAPRRRAASRTA